MTRDEIKKWLYKNKPKAQLIQIVKGLLNYKVDIRDENIATVVRILVPVSDIGDASFFPEMDAHLLIRWITE